MAYKTSDELSHLTTAQLRARRKRAARRFADVTTVVQGSLQRQSRRCGKEGCRCTKGELHGPYVYLSVRSARRARLVYVPADLAEEIGRRVRLSEQIEAALAEISAVNLELLARGRLD